MTEEKERKITMVRDVNMQVNVGLGRAQMPFKDILTLQGGSSSELNKTTGDRIDFLVNNKLVARGEVMVIDGKFALRITDIVGSLSQAVQEGLKQK